MDRKTAMKYFDELCELLPHNHVEMQMTSTQDFEGISCSIWIHCTGGTFEQPELERIFEWADQYDLHPSVQTEKGFPTVHILYAGTLERETHGA